MECPHGTTGRRGTFEGEVVANETICRDHYRLRLILPSLPPTAPGQFVQLQCRPLTEQAGAVVTDWPAGKLPRLAQAELADKEPMLRRPLSIASRRDRADGVQLEIIYRAVGAGTRWLAGVKSGARVSILGPLGNGFTSRADKPFAALIGGGVGLPPMLYLADSLNAAGRAAVLFAGARSGSWLPLEIDPANKPSPDGRPRPCLPQLNAICTDAAVATDDGSVGYHGLVSELFVQWLGDHDFDPRDVAVYCCGPEPMERAIAGLCVGRGIECQLSLERHMACGMGTCQSCVVKVRDASERGWSFKLCCSDGPVFDAADMLW